MKRILFGAFLSFSIASYAQPVVFESQIKLPISARNAYDIVYDVALPNIITGIRTLYEIKIYVQDSETNFTDSFKLEQPTIGKREMPLDIKIISIDTFYLLTTERLIKIHHTGKSYNIVKSEPLEKGKERYSSIMTHNGELYLAAQFSTNAKRFPKIKIWNRSKGTSYTHFANCDAHAIYTGYCLTSINSNGVFCVVKDNTKPSVTFIGQDLKEIRTVEILPPNPPEVANKLCEYDNKYNAKGSQQMYDSMSKYINLVATIEKAIFIGDNKVLIVGMSRGSIDLDPYMEVVSFDDKWNIISREQLNVFPTAEQRALPFSNAYIKMNPYGTTTKTNGGRLFLPARYVDTSKLKLVSDFNNVRSSLVNTDCLYLFKVQ